MMMIAGLLRTVVSQRYLRDYMAQHPRRVIFKFAVVRTCNSVIAGCEKVRIEFQESLRKVASFQNFMASSRYQILWSLSSRTTTAKPNQIINSLMNHLQLTLQRFLALHEWSFSWNSSHNALFVPHLQPLPLVTTQSRNFTFLVPKDQPLTHLRSPCFNCSLRHAEF
jgi:hypothetical protein